MPRPLALLTRLERFSPELAEDQLLLPEQVRCWRAGTSLALADWLRGRGYMPVFLDAPKTQDG